jgi:hypothetical protein
VLVESDPVIIEIVLDEAWKGSVQLPVLLLFRLNDLNVLYLILVSLSVSQVVKEALHQVNIS